LSRAENCEAEEKKGGPVLHNLAIIIAGSPNIAALARISA